MAKRKRPETMYLIFCGPEYSGFTSTSKKEAAERASAWNEDRDVSGGDGLLPYVVCRFVSPPARERG